MHSLGHSATHSHMAAFCFVASHNVKKPWAKSIGPPMFLRRGAEIPHTLLVCISTDQDVHIFMAKLQPQVCLVSFTMSTGQRSQKRATAHEGKALEQDGTGHFAATSRTPERPVRRSPQFGSYCITLKGSAFWLNTFVRC